MTREEAIAILNRNVSACLHGTEWGDALDAAIKALEQQTCTDAISRSEAIRIASGYCHWSNIPDELAKLPSVNPNPCEDAISRQAAIDEIFSEPLYKTGLKKRGAEEAVPAIFEKIKALPSVSTEKTGHNCNEDYADCDQFVCSECGIELQDWNRVERDEDDGEISYHEYTFNYCPNCGCRMVEPQESED